MRELFAASEMTPSETAASNVVRLDALPRPVIANADHPRRALLERFVAERFEAAYDAQVRVDYPLIAGFVAADGSVLAAAGVRFAETQPLFLERYLDTAAETAIGQTFDRPVARSSVVEIGAFASHDPAWSLDLFAALPDWLASVCGRRFAVATLRPELARTLTRAGFALRSLAPADPARLGAEVEAWGRYYASAPQVYAGRIGPGSSLSEMRDRLKTRGMEREARRLARGG